MCQLTKLEMDALGACYRSNYHDNIGIPDMIWSFSVTDSCRIIEKNQISGVISSLAKKGIVECDRYDNTDDVISVTALGHEMATKHGLT